MSLFSLVGQNHPRFEPLETVPTESYTYDAADQLLEDDTFLYTHTARSLDRLSL